jgi:hypothetical protein
MLAKRRRGGGARRIRGGRPVRRARRVVRRSAPRAVPELRRSIYCSHLARSDRNRM